MQTFPAMPISCKDDRCSMLSAPFSDSDSTDSQQVPSSFALRCEMPTAPTPLPKKESGVSVNTRDDTAIPSQEPGLSQELQGLEASPGDPQSVLPPQTPSRTPTLSQVQTGGTAGKAPACQCRR